MTYAPRRLLDLRSYLHNQTGLPFVSLGIIGSRAHKETGTSYHLGADDLKKWKDPYSTRTARDRAGLSNAASATDTGWFGRLVELTMWAVGEARDGRRPDTREIIGPWSDGRAYRFDHLGGWRAQLRARGDSHETHMHESWYRDSEHRNKVQFYRPFFEGDGSEGSNDDMIGLREGDEGQDVKGLQAMLRKAGHSPGEVDGIYGPATSAAVLAMRKSMGSSAKSGKAFTGHAYAQLQDAHARRRADQAANEAKRQMKAALEAALADLPAAGELPARVVLDLPDTIIVPVEPAGDEDDEGGA